MSRSDGYLSLDELRALAEVGAKHDLGISPRRELLFGAMSRDFMLRLPVHSIPQAQVYSDLLMLNFAPAQDLMAYLEAADWLSRQEEFGRALRRVRERARAAKGTATRADMQSAITRLIRAVDENAPPPQVEAAISETKRVAERIQDPALYAEAHARIAWARAMLGDQRSARIDAAASGSHSGALRRFLKWLAEQPGRKKSFAEQPGRKKSSGGS